MNEGDSNRALAHGGEDLAEPGVGLHERDHLFTAQFDCLA
jgi:hypothetical protein